ncbi:alpha/beta hydrolase [Histidinibacterium aquaticum]|uniref:Palmitoyl-protein thioesterase ABHD10, mitochondrial n=1 Tax=Histidinibacterium aquaticum TaxID=2613962 RepID=A0A5J5GQL2_9RHOB|nr:alpha/beta hydrolase [Histidinibacterium aquaticum]KAA9009848.1 alpha/beta hydrolase [Histidinibacterium aquaticum]
MDKLTGPEGRQIAFCRTAGEGPPVVFLGGFRSDMSGTKAVHLEAWARRQGRAFLRFDYSGHGESSGRFEDGAIGDWYEDALAALDLLGEPAVLVGSSMGGWISCLITREHPDRVAGLVTIAAAPDFTEDGYWASFDIAQRETLATQGVVHVPSQYGEAYPITRRLIEEGRERFVLRSPLRFDVPVRMLQGTDDPDVSVETALRLLGHAEGPDIRLTLVKGADHRFSRPENLPVIEAAIEEVLASLAA